MESQETLLEKVKKLERSLKILRTKNRKLENENIRLDERSKVASECSEKFVNQLLIHHSSTSEHYQSILHAKRKEYEDETPSKKMKITDNLRLPYASIKQEDLIKVPPIMGATQRVTAESKTGYLFGRNFPSFKFSSPAPIVGSPDLKTQSVQSSTAVKITSFPNPQTVANDGEIEIVRLENENNTLIEEVQSLELQLDLRTKEVVALKIENKDLQVVAHEQTLDKAQLSQELNKSRERITHFQAICEGVKAKADEVGLENVELKSKLVAKNARDLPTDSNLVDPETPNKADKLGEEKVDQGKQNEDFEFKCAALTSEVVALKTKMRDLEEISLNKTEELHKLENVNKNIKCLGRKYREKFKKSELDVEKGKADAMNLSKELVQARIFLENVQAELNAKTDDLTSATQDMQKMIEECEDIKKQNQDLELNSFALTARVANLKSKAKERDQIICKQTDGLMKSNSIIKNLKSIGRTYRDKYDTSLAEVEKLKRKVEETPLGDQDMLQADMTTEKDDVLKLTQEEELLKGKVVNLQADMSTEKDDVLKLTEEREELKGKVVNLQADMSTKADDVLKLTEEREKRNEKQEMLQADMFTKKDVVLKLTEERKELIGKVVNLQADMSTKTDDVLKLIEEREKLLELVRDHEINSAELTSEVTILRAKITDHEQIHLTQTEELQKSKGVIKDLKNIGRKYREQYETSKSEIEKLRQNLGNPDNDHEQAELTARNDDLRLNQENQERLTKENEELKQRNDVLEKQCIEKEARAMKVLETAKGKLSKLQNLVRDQSRIYKKALGELKSKETEAQKLKKEISEHRKRNEELEKTCSEREENTKNIKQSAKETITKLNDRVKELQAYEKNSTEAKKKEEPSEAGKLHDVVFELRRLNEDLKKTLLEKEGLTKQLEDNFTELKSQIDQQTYSNSMDENTKVEELTNERDTLRLEVTRAEILNELVKGAKDKIEEKHTELSNELEEKTATLNKIKRENEDMTVQTGNLEKKIYQLENSMEITKALLKPHKYRTDDGDAH